MELQRNKTGRLCSLHFMISNKMQAVLFYNLKQRLSSTLVWKIPMTETLTVIAYC